jgi:hypothetical protein
MGLFDTVNPILALIPVTGNAAGTSVIIDMQGYNGCAFVYNQGASTGGTTTPLVVSQSDNSNFSSSTVCASGTCTPGTAVNTFAVLDVWRPSGRYLRLTSTPAGTVAMGGIMAYQYGRTGTLPFGTATPPVGAGSASTYTRLQLN